MTFQIGIPTINRADLLIPTINLYRRDFPHTKIHILDNGNQNIGEAINLFGFPNLKLIESRENIGVGASWNFLCEQIFKEADHALILNDDIYMGKTEMDIQSIFSRKNSESCFFRATPDWCAFLIPKTILETIGKFDECFFPAYYEDSSYEYRMKLQGIIPIKTPLLNPVLYRSSQTLEKMPTLIEASKRNNKLYMDMWGGDVGKEKFKTPFNK